MPLLEICVRRLPSLASDNGSHWGSTYTPPRSTRPSCSIWSATTACRGGSVSGWLTPPRTERTDSSIRANTRRWGRGWAGSWRRRGARGSSHPSIADSCRACSRRASWMPSGRRPPISARAALRFSTSSRMGRWSPATRWPRWLASRCRRVRTRMPCAAGSRPDSPATAVWGCSASVRLVRPGNPDAVMVDAWRRRYAVCARFPRAWAVLKRYLGLIILRLVVLFGCWSGSKERYADTDSDSHHDSLLPRRGASRDQVRSASDRNQRGGERQPRLFRRQWPRHIRTNRHGVRGDGRRARQHIPGRHPEPPRAQDCEWHHHNRCRNGAGGLLRGWWRRDGGAILFPARCGRGRPGKPLYCRYGKLPYP